MEQRIISWLGGRERDGLLRKLTPVLPDKHGRIHAGDKEFINFSSNDYLGLSSHPDMIRAAREAIGPVFGASASRLMTGNTGLHEALERKIAGFKGKPAALVFNSGYQANVGVISALCGRSDVIFSDRLNHASIVDGILLSKAKLFRYRHNDTSHLEELLSRERRKYRKALIITETIFSMDGDITPIREIVSLKKRFGSLLMADEAHATGVFGETGAGILEQAGITDDCDIAMGTFSKALGSFGAYIASSRAIKKYLVNTCRGFIYSTALPPSVINASIAAIDAVKKEPFRRTGLLAAAALLRRRFQERGLDVRGESQIVPVILGDSTKSVRAAGKLREKGYWVTPVRPPTVPEGTARLRISVTYDHARDVLERFADDLCEILKDLA